MRLLQKKARSGHAKQALWEETVDAVLCFFHHFHIHVVFPKSHKFILSPRDIMRKSFCQIEPNPNQIV